MVLKYSSCLCDHVLLIEIPNSDWLSPTDSLPFADSIECYVSSKWVRQIDKRLSSLKKTEKY
jgi:hypothetical protein